MLVGCYTPDKGTASGIAVVEPDQGVTAIIRADSPSFVVRHPRLPVIYAVAEEDPGRVAAWSNDGGTAAPLGTGETGGADPCHLAVHESGDYLVTANYSGGSIAVHALGPEGAIGARTDLVAHVRTGTHERQRSPHVHMVRLDGDRVLASDLGADAIYEYRLDGGTLVRVAIHETPSGSGPRHFRPLGDGWVVATELSGELLTFDGDWQLTGRVPGTAVTDVECLVSELALGADGRYLYLANRGPDTIAVFRIEGSLPVYVTEVPCGRWPRHILVDGDRLYVANQLGDEVVTMRIDTATGVPEIVDRLAVPSPTCILR